MKLAARMARIGTESAFEVLRGRAALEAQGRSIIHLEIGEPDFPTPRHIVEAGKAGARRGLDALRSHAGVAGAAEAIASHVSADARNRRSSPSTFASCPAASRSCFFRCWRCSKKGDEVIYPNPGFPIYESMIDFLGASRFRFRCSKSAASPSISICSRESSRRTDQADDP